MRRNFQADLRAILYATDLKSVHTLNDLFQRHVKKRGGRAKGEGGRGHERALGPAPPGVGGRRESGQAEGRQPGQKPEGGEGEGQRGQGRHRDQGDGATKRRKGGGRGEEQGKKARGRATKCQCQG